MKLRMSINRSTTQNTPDLNRHSLQYFKNQKRRHAEVKNSINLERSDSTPSCQTFIRPRRTNSLRSSSSSFNSFKTPRSSDGKGLALCIRSNSSSGYQSLQNSKKSLKKNAKPKIPMRRCLNISLFLQDVVKVPKISKFRFYSHPKLTSFMPPRALTSSNNISGHEIWKCMIEKEAIYLRDPNYFNRQFQIQQDMRAILIEWMKEVCDAYNLDAETHFLAVDYVDRYLSIVNDVPVHSLQAIGTTCLYLASKLHEITPPSVESFASVTDGACSKEDVLLHELDVLVKLNWHLQPITILSWLKLFLQIYHMPDLSSNHGPLTRKRYFQSFEGPFTSKSFLLPKDTYEQHVCFQILNSSIRDPGILRFPYPVVAASILHITTNVDVFNITGYGLEEIGGCSKWLKQIFAHMPSTISPNKPAFTLTDRTNIPFSHCGDYQNIPLIENIEKENISPNAY